METNNNQQKVPEQPGGEEYRGKWYIQGGVIRHKKELFLPLFPTFFFSFLNSAITLRFIVTLRLSISCFPLNYFKVRVILKRLLEILSEIFFLLEWYRFFLSEKQRLYIYQQTRSLAQLFCTLTIKDSPKYCYSTIIIQQPEFILPGFQLTNTLWGIERPFNPSHPLVHKR